ncbi:methyltransferase, FxLD system [Paractinoplanes maris]|uniref:methyltransferase, FxLD system n=1 Tax=Paractinoplanes maris TaxID=1734446 RepID=UPI0020221FB3|nr:methyltransferase, FxLD system [Actinoplanes maris]
MNELMEDLSPETARQQLVEHLTAKGWITHPEVAAAFSTVPRHEFAPAGTSVRAAYADDTVITVRTPDGATTSSISAPWLQAHMLETARLRPGGRVLEIGSGGYNAALIAELVGPAGTVVSVDIDAQVIANAQAALARTGYGQVVEAICADGENGYPGGGPYDAILVTVECSDIPPAWIEQLAPEGLLVAPVRMRANTRCLTLRRRGDHLVAIAARQCGFVPMQGAGHDPVRRTPLLGNDIVLTIDDPSTTADAEALAAALHTPRVEVWSPVTARIDEGGAFESIHLWLASQPRPYGALTVDRSRVGDLLDPDNRFVCPTLLAGDSFAHLTLRRHEQSSYQFGAHGFGPGGAAPAAELADLIVAWDQHHRHGSGPGITVHPVGAPLPATDDLQLLLPRRHSQVAITWPGGGR